jgi:hypothetical protein
MQHLLQILAQNPKKSQRERHTEVTVVLDRYAFIIPVMKVNFHIIFLLQILKKMLTHLTMIKAPTKDIATILKGLLAFKLKIAPTIIQKKF